MDSFLTDGLSEHEQRRGCDDSPKKHRIRSSSYLDSDADDADRGLRRIPSAVLTARAAAGSSSKKRKRTSLSPTKKPRSHEQGKTALASASQESADSLPAFADAPGSSQPIVLPADVTSSSPLCQPARPGGEDRTIVQVDDEGPSVSFIPSPGLPTGIARKVSLSSALSVYIPDEPDPNLQPAWMRAAPTTQMPSYDLIARRKSQSQPRPLGANRTPPQSHSQAQAQAGTSLPASSSMPKVSMSPHVIGFAEPSEIDEESLADEDEEHGSGSPSPSPKKTVDPHDFAADSLSERTKRQAQMPEPDHTAFETRSTQSDKAPTIEQVPKTAAQIANEMLAQFANLSPPQALAPPAAPNLEVRQKARTRSRSPAANSTRLAISQTAAVPLTGSGCAGGLSLSDVTPPIEIASSQTPPPVLLATNNSLEGVPIFATGGRVPSSKSTAEEEEEVPGSLPRQHQRERERSASVTYVQDWDPAYQEQAFPPQACAEEDAPLPAAPAPTSRLTIANLRRHLDRRQPSSKPRSRAAVPALDGDEASVPSADLSISQLGYWTDNRRRAFETPSPSPLSLQQAQSSRHTEDDNADGWAHVRAAAAAAAAVSSGDPDKRKRGNNRARSRSRGATSMYSDDPRSKGRSRNRAHQGKAVLSKKRSSASLKTEVSGSGTSLGDLLEVLPKRHGRAATAQEGKRVKDKARKDDSDSEASNDDSENDEDEAELQRQRSFRENWDDSDSSQDSKGSAGTLYDEAAFIRSTKAKSRTGRSGPDAKKARSEPAAAGKAKNRKPPKNRFQSVALEENDNYQRNKHRRLKELEALEEYNLEEEYGYKLPRKPKLKSRPSKEEQGKSRRP